MEKYHLCDTGEQFTIIDAVSEQQDSHTYTPFINNKSATFESTCSVNSKLFNRLVGIDLANSSDMTGFTMEYQAPYQVQCRRHKKKRINKKWAKRYGYKTVYRKSYLSDCSISNLGNGHFEVTGYPTK